MNWINKSNIIILIFSIISLYFAWNLKNFALLGLSASCISVFLASTFKKLQTVMIPLIACGFMFSLAEFVLPIFNDNEELVYYDPESDYVKGYNEKISGFGYRPTPGVHSSRKLSSDNEEIYNVSYTISNDGYRLDVFSDSYKVFIYGGSFTFGEGLNDNETISYYLFQNYQIESKNLGIHGYGLHQALYNIEQGNTSRNGINILLTSPWHALRSACKPSYAAGTPRYKIVDNRAVLDGICDEETILHKVLKRSHIFKLAEKALSNNKNVISDDDMDLYLAIVKEISRLTKENNSKLLIAFIDATEDQMAKTKWTNQSLVTQFELIADKVVDVTLAQSREELSPEYYIHELDQHPSALANSERAALIAKAVNDLISQ